MDRVYGRRIQQAREIRMVTRARLAELIGRTERDVVRYETDLEQPLVGTLERIAIVLSWPIGFFRRRPPEWDFPLGSLLFHELADKAKSIKSRTSRLRDIQENPDAHHHDFGDLQLCCMVNSAIDGQMLEAHPDTGRNAGRKCDVVSGPCSCGGWH